MPSTYLFIIVIMASVGRKNVWSTNVYILLKLSNTIKLTFSKQLFPEPSVLCLWHIFFIKCHSEVLLCFCALEPVCISNDYVFLKRIVLVHCRKRYGIPERKERGERPMDKDKETKAREMHDHSVLRPYYTINHFKHFICIRCNC